MLDIVAMLFILLAVGAIALVGAGVIVAIVLILRGKKTQQQSLQAAPAAHQAHPAQPYPAPYAQQPSAAQPPYPEQQAQSAQPQTYGHQPPAAPPQEHLPGQPHQQE